MPQLQLYRLELSTNSTCVLVGSWLFCIQLSMFGKFSVTSLEAVWRFEWRTLYVSSLRVKLVLECQEVLKWVWPSTNPNKLLFNQIQTLSPSTHHKWQEIVDVVCKTTNRYSHRGPTPDKKSHRVERYLYYPKKAGTPQNPKKSRVSKWTEREMSFGVASDPLQSFFVWGSMDSTSQSSKHV